MLDKCSLTGPLFAGTLEASLLKKAASLHWSEQVCGNVCVSVVPYLELKNTHERILMEVESNHTVVSPKAA